MKWTHLSTWDQEEYVLGQRTPEMVRHLSQCSACFAEVERMERGIALFRESAHVWSAENLEKHPGRPPVLSPAKVSLPSTPPWAWALAAALLLLAFLPFGSGILSNSLHRAQQPAANLPSPISDDALLQQVDEEVSNEVPSSMEPLTHLVSTTGETTAAGVAAKNGGRRRAETD